MGIVADLLGNVELPRMVPIRQSFDGAHMEVGDIPGVVAQQLDRPELRAALRPGMEIAVTVGSRGVTNIALIVRSVVEALKAAGTKPFVVPAMGSHGGATAEGQRGILEGYGVTESYIGCEIRSSMETVEIGRTATGLPVRIDKNASRADGIVVLGRVKAHTGFRGPYESGIMKMMAIGLGKQYGAEIIHADGFGRLGEYIPLFGRAILENAPVLCGLAVVENAYDQTRRIVSLTPQEIIDREPALLVEAKECMSRILFDDCDVLVVDKMGKNISGDGMDPNVTGRFPSDCASGGIRAQRLAVLDLTDESHGNACGIGLADCTTRRLFRRMDLEQTYPNAITNTAVGEIKIPMVLGSDRLAIQAALKSCCGIDRAAPRIIRIRSTAELEFLEISEGMAAEAAADPRIEVLGEARPFAFDENGNLF